MLYHCPPAATIAALFQVFEFHADYSHLHTEVMPYFAVFQFQNEAFILPAICCCCLVRFQSFFKTFWRSFDQRFKMADARFEDRFEYFLDDDSGDEFEGFTSADLRAMDDITATSVEHDSVNI